MGNGTLDEFAKFSMKSDVSSLECEIGDTVRVVTSVKEGKKEREQTFEGTVIASKGSGITENFTVRRIAFGVGVEKIFPVHSPNTKSVKVIRKGRVRRAKLYYLRGKIGKNAKIKELKT